MIRKRGRAREPIYDPAFGDQALAAGRLDMTMGRWEGARDLLASGRRDDWDARAHRIRLLADAAADRRTVDLWQASDPGDPDAAVLLAETEVMRMFAVARTGAQPKDQDLDRVVGICLQAARLASGDPQPWVSLMALGRLYPGGHPHLRHWWQELTARDPYHREGHHQRLRHHFARWHGSHVEANDFAWDCVAYAPPGSPLAILPTVARAEQYRYRVETEGEMAPGLGSHWSGDWARWELAAAMDKWIADRRTPAAQDVADLNHLAHGLVRAGMRQEAAQVFHLLQNRATKVPWCYSGDPERQFVVWRDEVTT